MKLLILLFVLMGCGSDDDTPAEKLQDLQDGCVKLASKVGATSYISFNDENPNTCVLKTEHGNYPVGELSAVEGGLSILTTKRLIETHKDRMVCKTQCMKDTRSKYPNETKDNIEGSCIFDCIEKFGIEL